MTNEELTTKVEELFGMLIDAREQIESLNKRIEDLEYELEFQKDCIREQNE